MQPKVELSTVLIVKNRCQFCFAFFKDAAKIAEHSERCVFRFSETFEAFDGKVKFACAVCFDVFQTRADQVRHEQLHTFPGGFPCSICHELFMNDVECVQHMERDHEVTNDGYLATTCHECGAFFEKETYLRLHNETNCGRHRTWHCTLCGPNLVTEDAFNQHMAIRHKVDIEEENVYVITKIEENESEAIDPIGSFTLADIAYSSNNEPLPLELKEETCFDEDSENTQTILDDGIDGVDETPAEVPRKFKRKQCVVIEVYLDNDSETIADEIPEDETEAGGQFACKYCDKKYIRLKRLENHMANHGPEGNLVHRCNVCLVYFETKEERDTHWESIHKKEKKFCEICRKPFRDIKTLYSHKRAHENGQIIIEQTEEPGIEDSNECKPDARMRSEDELSEIEIDDVPNPSAKKNKGNYECKYCRKKFTRQKTLDTHIVGHGPDGSLLIKCKGCNTYFKSRVELSEHTAIAHKDRVTCEICGKICSQIDSLYSHRQAVHRGYKYKSEILFCAKCGRSFTSRSYLDAHEKSDCGRSPSFKCDDCGKSFIYEYSLKNHRIVHSEERNFECIICKKRYRTKQSLKSHLVSHSSERPHKCQFCDKRFADLGYLKTHLTLHAAIKRYACHGCGSRFPTNSALHKHRKTRKDTCALVPIQPPSKSSTDVIR